MRRNVMDVSAVVGWLAIAGIMLYPAIRSSDFNLWLQLGGIIGIVAISMSYSLLVEEKRPLLRTVDIIDLARTAVLSIVISFGVISILHLFFGGGQDRLISALVAIGELIVVILVLFMTADKVIGVRLQHQAITER